MSLLEAATEGLQASTQAAFKLLTNGSVETTDGHNRKQRGEQTLEDVGWTHVYLGDHYKHGNIEG